MTIRDPRVVKYATNETRTVVDLDKGPVFDPGHRLACDHSQISTTRSSRKSGFSSWPQ